MEFFETIGQFLWVLLQAVLAIGLIGFVFLSGSDDDEEEEEEVQVGSVGPIFTDYVPDPDRLVEVQPGYFWDPVTDKYVNRIL